MRSEELNLEDVKASHTLAGAGKGGGRHCWHTPASWETNPRHVTPTDARNRPPTGAFTLHIAQYIRGRPDGDRKPQLVVVLFVLPLYPRDYDWERNAVLRENRV